MGAIVFFLALPLIYLVSVLPRPLLYGLSDGLRFLFYRVIKYRRKVIYTNLRNAFPEKSESELRGIERNFYRHLVDLMLETIKNLTISKRGAMRWASFSAGINRLHEHTDVIALMGHMGNWEALGAAYSQQAFKIKLQVLYSPFSNRWFNWLLKHIRLRNNIGIINKHHAATEIPRLLGTRASIVFIADQATRPESACWTRFLNQDTPVARGAERYARKYNLPVYYFWVNKAGRGRYTVDFILVAANPTTMAPDAITEAYTRLLEQNVQQQPEIWLWSHRRWKHRKPDIVGPPNYG